MALYIRDISSVPEGGWRYPMVASDKFIVAPYGILHERVVEHYTSNNVQPPSWDKVVKWMCENLSIPCIEGQEPFANRWLSGLPAPLVGCCGR